MASALVTGLLAAGFTPRQFAVVEPMQGQRERLASTLGVETFPSTEGALNGADVVVWAVKPQVLFDAIAGARPFLGEALHISIAAGVSSQDLSRWLGSARVVRVMPNTGAMVGAGVTGMLARPGLGQVDHDLAARVLAATGYCFWVDSDERLDAVTAVSGSGPAYIYHFLESVQAAAQALGFPEDQARELVLRTAAGAVRQAQASNAAFTTLKQNVTSKHGTTEAALAVLDARETPLAISAATAAAFARAGELSRELGRPA